MSGFSCKPLIFAVPFWWGRAVDFKCSFLSWCSSLISAVLLLRCNTQQTRSVIKLLLPHTRPTLESHSSQWLWNHLFLSIWFYLWDRMSNEAEGAALIRSNSSSSSGSHVHRLKRCCSYQVQLELYLQDHMSTAFKSAALTHAVQLDLVLGITCPLAFKVLLLSCPTSDRPRDHMSTDL